MTLYVRQQKRHKCKEQTFGLCGKRWGWDDLGEYHWNMYITICEIDCQSKFNAWDRVLRGGTLWWPCGMGWGGRWEGESGWETNVHPWLIHVNVWKNHYNIVKSLASNNNKLIKKFFNSCNITKVRLVSRVSQLKKDFWWRLCSQDGEWPGQRGWEYVMELYEGAYAYAHSLSPVWLFAMLWTVAQQAPLSMGFSRQEYWSGLPFPLQHVCIHTV